ncbi:hypothetical protein BI347_12815 [Chromobacterium sphagni]|uniref:Uncharacterized protein n=1 Tax=Chromobacterium sphagni TaxID=1903179 RepID=A0A1S1X460_9NEIS|nr:hypothetical protein BI347_12815 [Chromobacterium sphagni]
MREAQHQKQGLKGGMALEKEAGGMRFVGFEYVLMRINDIGTLTNQTGMNVYGEVGNRETRQ